MNAKIRYMRLEDLEDIMHIEHKSFTIPWAKTSFEKELQDNDSAVYIIAHDNKNVIGYGGMWKVIDEGHITNIAVHPDYRNNRIGCLLLEGLIDIAKQLNLVSMTLEVRESNHIARRLYAKYRFYEAGKRKKYYQDNREDAVIMWKRL